jgi:hypothetical protein
MKFAIVNSRFRQAGQPGVTVPATNVWRDQPEGIKNLNITSQLGYAGANDKIGLCVGRITGIEPKY